MVYVYVMIDYRSREQQSNLTHLLNGSQNFDTHHHHHHRYCYSTSYSLCPDPTKQNTNTTNYFSLQNPDPQYHPTAVSPTTQHLTSQASSPSSQMEQQPRPLRCQVGTYTTWRLQPYPLRWTFRRESLLGEWKRVDTTRRGGWVGLGEEILWPEDLPVQGEWRLLALHSTCVEEEYEDWVCNGFLQEWRHVYHLWLWSSW